MGTKGQEEEFDGSLELLDQALRNGIKQFAVWMARNWKMTHAEWVKSFADAPPDGDYFAGYNAGVESAVSACEHFLDENLN